MSANTIAIVLRYRDPRQAAQWLSDAFGFSLDHVEEASPGSVDYICLSYGPSVVIVCPQVESSTDAPGESQTCYLTVEDIGAHFAQAESRGALIERRPEPTEEGSALYVCRDPEGHLWSVGTHDFSTTRLGSAATARAHSPRPSAGRSQSRTIGLMALTAFVASAVTASAFYALVADAPPPLMGVAKVVEEATEDPTSKALRADLARLQRQRVEQAAATQQIKAELHEHRQARARAERELLAAQSELEQHKQNEAARQEALAAAQARLAALTPAVDGPDESDVLLELAKREEEARHERSARQSAEAELARALAQRAEASAAREAAVADREAATARLAEIEATEQEQARKLKQTIEALEAATTALASAQQEHETSLAARDETIDVLKEQLASTAPTRSGQTVAAPPAPKLQSKPTPPARVAKKAITVARPKSSAATAAPIKPGTRRCRQLNHDDC